MNKLIPIVLAAVAGMLVTPPAKGVMIDNRPAWEGAVGTWTDVSEAQIPVDPVNLVPFPGPLLLPSGTTITFDQPLLGAQVPDTWSTWSGGNTPRVLFSSAASLTGTASGAINSFGLEMEPNAFDFVEMTLTLSDGNSLTRLIDNSLGSGAMFFGWANEPVVEFTITVGSLDGFAFGRMVEGPGAPSPVPDGGSVGLMSGLVWAGLLAFYTVRRKSS